MLISRKEIIKIMPNFTFNGKIEDFQTFSKNRAKIDFYHITSENKLINK